VKNQDPIAVGDLVLVHTKLHGEAKVGLVTSIGAFIDVVFLDGAYTCVHRAFIQKIKKNEESS
jgi:hypothetical protein